MELAMADTNNYFNTELPKRIESDPGLIAGLSATFQFEIDGAGTWCVSSEGISEGASESAGCVIASDKDTFDAILDDANLLVSMWMSGKLTASDQGLAYTQLMPISERLFS